MKSLRVIFLVTAIFFIALGIKTDNIFMSIVGGGCAGIYNASIKDEN